MEKIDYNKIGLKVGLEIHQQLDTKHKLFCNCPTILRDDPPHRTIIRKLRPTQSELGEIDPAALFEFKKGRIYIYETYDDTICLVEHDEEPPHDLNPEALEIALQIALMLNAKPVDEVHVMRKIVIDGSNTTGFQRTAIIAMGGYIEDEEGKIEIKTICLEEEAARKIKEEGNKTYYRLDRLGIPLIEIATAPEIKNPEQARRVALKIGQIMRATGRVKRGIGTIRQDLNISIRGGARIEIKGVQELNLIPKIVELEVQRQINLLKIKEELLSRGLREEELKLNYQDVTEIFKNTKSRLIRRLLNKGATILALKLPKFAGLLGREIQPNRRLATEMAERARFWSGIGGIIHTDELPKYGITIEEVKKIREATQANEEDAVVIVIGEKESCIEALKSVLERAIEALKGVPKETRAANNDGTTRYSRPMPGAARMYPETDVRPIPITQEYIEKLKKTLPETYEKKIERFIKQYKLSEKLAREIASSDKVELFEEIVKEVKVPPTLIASTLEYTLKSLKREGVKIENITNQKIKTIFKYIEQGKIVKEAIPEILKWLAENPDKNIDNALKALGVELIPTEELEKIIDKIISKNIQLIKSRGMKAIGPIMGEVMRKVRGKADGRKVNEIVKNKIKEQLSKK